MACSRPARANTRSLIGPMISRRLAKARRHRRITRFDHRTAQAFVVAIKHHRLPRRDRALRPVEAHIERAVVADQYFASLIALAITVLRGATQLRSRR